MGFIQKLASAVDTGQTAYDRFTHVKDKVKSAIDRVTNLDKLALASNRNPITGQQIRRGDSVVSSGRGGVFRVDLEAVRRELGNGNVNANIYNLYHGFNHRGTGDLTSVNLDTFAYVFFTKPMLNLTAENVGGIRRLQYLSTDNPYSAAAAIKSLLTYGPQMATYENNTCRSAAVDDRNPFIVPFSNTLLSLTGWPDEDVDYHTSDVGVGGEVHGWIDMLPVNYGTFDLSATFINKESDPVTTILSTWREYACSVADGRMVPFPDFIATDTIDYNTRIYVVITDKTKTYMQKIACTGASLPGPSPMGAGFNYTNENVFATDNAQVSTSFKCFGVRYNDPQTIRDFNSVVEMYNPSMASRKGMRKLTIAERMGIFNNKGYPYLNRDTHELEWWIDLSLYNRVNAALSISPTPNTGEDITADEV